MSNETNSMNIINLSFEKRFYHCNNRLIEFYAICITETWRVYYNQRRLAIMWVNMIFCNIWSLGKCLRSRCILNNNMIAKSIFNLNTQMIVNHCIQKCSFSWTSLTYNHHYFCQGFFTWWQFNLRILINVHSKNIWLFNKSFAIRKRNIYFLILKFLLINRGINQYYLAIFSNIFNC